MLKSKRARVSKSADERRREIMDAAATVLAERGLASATISDITEAAGVAKSGTLWAAERQVVAVGADNMAWDAPDERDPETGATLFAHLRLLAQKGVYIIENLNLEGLAADRRHEFAFVGVALKLNGATGSPIRPLALA